MVLTSSVLQLAGVRSILRCNHHRIPQCSAVAVLSNSGGSRVQQTCPGAPPPAVMQLYQVRFKNKGAKMGLHLEKLEELAHRKRHEEAVEKRRIKKEKTLARKGKSKHKESSAKHVKDDDLDDIDYDEEEGEEEEENEFGDEEEDEAQGKKEQSEEPEEPSLPKIGEIKERMNKIVEKYVESLSSIRGSEPTLEMFDRVTVNAYGDPRTPLQAVAQVVITSNTLAHATCYDPELAKNVDLAIRNHMSLNPSIEDGGVVKIPIPRPSLESRQKSVQQLHKRTESTRQRIRNVRRDAHNLTKQGVAGKLPGVSKDDAFRVQQDLEKITEDSIQKVNQAMAKKEENIMSV